MFFLTFSEFFRIWWRILESNQWPDACKAPALPTELIPLCPFRFPEYPHVIFERFGVIHQIRQLYLRKIFFHLLQQFRRKFSHAIYHIHGNMVKLIPTTMSIIFTGFITTLCLHIWREKLTVPYRHP